MGKELSERYMDSHSLGKTEKFGKSGEEKMPIFICLLGGILKCLKQSLYESKYSWETTHTKTK